MSISELEKDVLAQEAAVKQAIEAADGRFFIDITDSVCALDFNGYAVRNERDGSRFSVEFKENPVEVSVDDFVRYQFHYSDDALALEEKYEVDYLRDAQAKAMERIKDWYMFCVCGSGNDDSLSM